MIKISVPRWWSEIFWERVQSSLVGFWEPLIEPICCTPNSVYVPFDWSDLFFLGKQSRVMGNWKWNASLGFSSQPYVGQSQVLGSDTSQLFAHQRGKALSRPSSRSLPNSPFGFTLVWNLSGTTVVDRRARQCSYLSHWCTFFKLVGGFESNPSEFYGTEWSIGNSFGMQEAGFFPPRSQKTSTSPVVYNIVKAEVGLIVRAFIEVYEGKGFGNMSGTSPAFSSNILT